MASLPPEDRPTAVTPPSPPLQPAPAAAGLFGRVQRVLMQPKEERLRVDAEPMTLQGLYTGWILPLAAIAPVAGLIRALAFPITVFGVTIRTSPGAAIGNAIVQYILAVAMVFLVALVIDALAPTFNGQKNQIQATKVVAFSSTPGWVAGVFQIIPSLSLAGLIGLIAALYGLYLLYLALPTMMKAPEDKAIPYIAVVILVAVVAFFLVGALAGAGAAMFAPPAPSYGSITVS